MPIKSFLHHILMQQLGAHCLPTIRGQHQNASARCSCNGRKQVCAWNSMFLRVWRFIGCFATCEDTECHDVSVQGLRWRPDAMPIFERADQSFEFARKACKEPATPAFKG